jgi:hypothetical protein
MTAVERVMVAVRVWVALVALGALGAGWWWWSADQQRMSVLITVLVVMAALAVVPSAALAWVVGRRDARLAARRRVVGRAVSAARTWVGDSDESGSAVAIADVRRWRGLTPERVEVRWSRDEWPGNGEPPVRRLEKLLAAELPGRWVASKVRATRVLLDRLPEDPAENERELVETRVESLLRRTIAGTKTVFVEWPSAVPHEEPPALPHDVPRDSVPAASEAAGPAADPAALPAAAPAVGPPAELVLADATGAAPVMLPAAGVASLVKELSPADRPAEGAETGRAANESPVPSRVKVTYEPTPKVASERYRGAVELVVSTTLPGRWRADWQPERDRVTFMPRPELPQRLLYPLDLKPETGVIPYGLDEDLSLHKWHLDRAPHLLGVGPTGGGKALALSTKIPTPLGWTTMGELKDGDQVFDELGRPCTVLTAHPVRYDRPCFEVEFSDGSTIVADAEHLWWTQTRADRLAIAGKVKKDRLRGKPRQRRMNDTQLSVLRSAAAEASPRETITIPEAAELAGMTPTHDLLYEIAAELGPAGSESRPLEFHYREQVVEQCQTIRVYPRAETLEALADLADAPRWTAAVTANELRALADAAGPEEEVTLVELMALLGRTRYGVRGMLNRGHVEGRLATRIVRLNVPAKTVQRPWGQTRTYDKAEYLEKLLAWGEGLHKDRHQPRVLGAVRDTAEIVATLRDPKDGAINHSVPVAAPVQYPAADLPIPPYALGVWLGDGSTSGTSVASADPEILMHIEADAVEVADLGLPKSARPEAAYRMYALRGIRRHLNDLELLRVHHDERRTRSKHIPDCYLIASKEQRRLLLAGLLDTDGTIDDHGRVHFDNTNETLARHVLQLACSLGYRATITEGRAKLYGKDCGPKYRVAFMTTDVVFRLERKRLVHKERSARANPAKTRNRYIVDVRPVPSVPVRCITVDSPNSLYLVGETFIPTHNTSTIRSIILGALQLPEGAEVVGADPKLIELAGLVGYPGVRRIATEPEECVELLDDVTDEMWRRYELVRANPRAKKDLPRLFVVLDEFFIMRLRLNRLWRQTKPKDAKGSTHPAIETMPELAALARSARIHLILGIQRPDAEFLEGAARDNFRHRISVTTLSPDGARMMWGDGSTAGTDLPTIPGRAMATDKNGKPREIQVFWTPDTDPRLVDELSREEILVLTALRPGSIAEGTKLPERKTAAEEAVARGMAAGGVLLDPVPAEAETNGASSPASAPAADSEDRELMTDGDEVSAWARAEELTIGDQVELEGEWVELTEVMDDESDDEDDLVYLEWEAGSTTLSADETVKRMVGTLSAVGG